MLRTEISPNTLPAPRVARGYGSQGSKDAVSVVGDDRQTAALDDVQLFADIALATHEVAGTVDGQS